MARFCQQATYEVWGIMYFNLDKWQSSEVLLVIGQRTLTLIPGGTINRGEDFQQARASRSGGRIVAGKIEVEALVRVVGVAVRDGDVGRLALEPYELGMFMLVILC